MSERSEPSKPRGATTGHRTAATASLVIPHRDATRNHDPLATSEITLETA
jgi:hypothetical protein